jgi:formyl-CoA transferase
LGPLDGVKVIEFSEIVAGPVAGMLLSDLGAEVTKIEPPWGDPWRHHEATVPGEARVFASVNRGKRSITLDLTSPDGRSIVHRLAADADVLVHNHRPDVPQKLGIDYATLSSINPRLIYCEVSAYGEYGPDSGTPGYDIVMQGYSGLLSGEGKTMGGRPGAITSSPVIDLSTGHSIATAVCAALYARERTTRGQKLTFSLLANALFLQVLPLTSVEGAPTNSERWVADDLPFLNEAGVSYEDQIALYQKSRATAVYGLYYRGFQTRDGGIMVGCLSEPIRERLVKKLGLRDTRFEGADTQSDEYAEFFEGLIERAEEVFRTKTTAQWIAELEKAGVPAGPVRYVEELLHSEQARANEMIIEQDHPALGKVTTVGSIYRMSDTPSTPTHPAPTLGEHTDQILGGAGYSDAEIAAFRAGRVIA